MKVHYDTGNGIAVVKILSVDSHEGGFTGKEWTPSAPYTVQSVFGTNFFCCCMADHRASYHGLTRKGETTVSGMDIMSYFTLASLRIEVGNTFYQPRLLKSLHLDLKRFLDLKYLNDIADLAEVTF